MLKNMTDRNLFDKKILPNGITLYTKIVDTAYSAVELVIPVGSRHNTGPYLPGTFHFLEHMCLERSPLFPDRYGFTRFLGLKSAHVNATTSYDSTNFYFSTPNQHLDALVPGFLASIFQPIFSKDEVDIHRAIISNERKPQERWFPSANELSQYICTQWQWDAPVSLNQRLGSDKDLADMTVPRLKDAHKQYFNSDIIVFYIGHQPSQKLEDQLSRLKVSKLPTLEKTWDHQRWVNKDYHIKAFRDVSQYKLHFGNFQRHPRPDFSQMVGKQFIINYLINPVHGPLFQWLREEKGWVYNINYTSNTDWCVTEWTMMVPLNNQEQVDIVRQEFWLRAEQALQDQPAIDLEVDRALGMRAYHYQTTSSIINSAVSDVDSFGRIISETEHRQAINMCRSREYLLEVYQQLFNPIDIGSFCAIPEPKQT